jgi:predicted nucleic-acid-binding Zn-ribbon protein
MQDDSLRSGKCPKCGANNVYTDRELPKRGERMQLVVSSWKWFFLDTYVCLSCGHFEEFVRETELRDEKTIEKIRETWKKV